MKRRVVKCAWKIYRQILRFGYRNCLWTFAQERGWERMNFGFNSNVRVGEIIYHVQTEDRGPSHPFLDTVVYLAGRVIYKRSTSYQKFAGGAQPNVLAQALHERLSEQHQAVIAELEAGTLPLHGKAAEIKLPKAVDPKSALEIQLANPDSWYSPSNMVTLQIELCATGTQQRVSDADVEVCLEYQRRRIPCAESRTDARGCATLEFSMPENVADGTSLVLRATDGTRFGQLRFRLKAKSGEKTPAAVL